MITHYYHDVTLSMLMEIINQVRQLSKIILINSEVKVISHVINIIPLSILNMTNHCALFTSQVYICDEQEYYSQNMSLPQSLKFSVHGCSEKVHAKCSDNLKTLLYIM